MFHPVGSQPPSIYWRRRLIALAAAVVVLVVLVLTVTVLFSGGGKTVAQSTTPTPSPSPKAAGTTSSSPAPSSSSSSPASSKRKVAAHGSSTAPSTSTAPAAPCTASALQLLAQTDHSTYSVGQSPVLSLLVTNTTTTACEQNLADSQVLLRVYNGESRVWGSHDCKVEPGTDVRTLMAGHSVRVSVTWGGQSSQPNCAGTRQTVGAGTYTLYASLGTQQARAAQFSIS